MKRGKGAKWACERASTVGARPGRSAEDYLGVCRGEDYLSSCEAESSLFA